MIGCLVAAWLLLPVSQGPPAIPDSALDVQTIERDVLTRPAESVTAAVPMSVVGPVKSVLNVAVTPPALLRIAPPKLLP